MPDTPIALNFQPGIQRDNTALDADRCLDSLWTRWRAGRPRKMGGSSIITNGLSGVPRRVHMFYSGSQIICHVGTSKSIQQIVLNTNGQLVSIADRTPKSGFVGGPDVGWTIDAIFDTTTSIVQLVAHAVPDLDFQASPTQTTPFIGQITSTSPLTLFSNPTPPSGSYLTPSLAGGIVCVQPYVFGYDANGGISWSAPNLPLYLGTTGGTTGAGAARVSAQKIVAGMALRGGGVNSPAALFWSLSEVITAAFVGGTPIFAFNTISPSSSIISTDAVIEYDGLYFWCGIDRFLVYNGTIAEVPNFQNQDWFFNNMNWAFSAKTFAFKVPRYGEIWFCAPLFGNTEPSHAVIYNIRENYWYDTALPAGFRTCGYFAQGFRYPVMGSATPDNTGYKLWLHETGTDLVDSTGTTPLRAYFETPYFSGPKMSPPTNKGLSVQALEPDIIQAGDMMVNVISAPNAKAGDTEQQSVPLKAIPTMPQQQLVGFKTSQRLTRLHVESNVLGGTFISGKNIIHGEASEERITGGPGPTPGAA